MPRISTLIPNLVVADVDRSLAFYRDVLGFSVAITVPDHPPFVFVSVQSGDVSIYLNATESSYAEYPMFAERPIGGTFSLFLLVSDIEEVYAAIASRARVVMSLERKWYGVTEFAIEDPDGYVITFAERAQTD